MDKLHKIEKLLSELSADEKSLILQWVISDLSNTYPGVESNPDVCGGEACIVRTRIPVWLLVQGRKLGMNEMDLLQAYPTLRTEDLRNAWNYYRAHRPEIEQQIHENEAA